MRFCDNGPKARIYSNEECSISFKHITDDTGYNHMKYAKSAGPGYRAFKDLMSLFRRISTTPYNQLKNINDKFEYTALKDLTRPSGVTLYTFFEKVPLIQGEETKVIVIRFSGKDQRAIFLPDPIQCNILYLLACDFDLTLYNH